jgi:hypothetical protein
MKKLLAIIVLGLLMSNTSFAGYGSGELKFADNSVRNFQAYLQGKKGSPMRFLISADGSYTFWWYCPYSECEGVGDTQEAKKCTAASGSQCYTFAVRRSVKWKNGVDAKALKLKFSSKDSIEEIKDKLTALGFYGSNTVDRKKTKKIIPANNSNLASRLEQLNKLYKSGALTKDEFDKAKKKILN